MLRVNRRVSRADKGETARLLQEEWDGKWGSSYQARWADRPVPAEIVEAVESGWLSPTGSIVDLGCGTAEIAAWFAERGYNATAIDISQAAVDRAAAKHAALSASIEFIANDLCTKALPGRAFDILIDRGCLHQIPQSLVADYVANITSMAARDARMILFMKAFRGGRPFGDAEEMHARTEWVRRNFAGQFELESARPTFLHPENPDDRLPGIAYWLSRSA